MKSLLTKFVASVAGAVLLCLGVVTAGLGVTVIAVLAMFALAVAGLGLLGAPFVALLQSDAGDAEAPQATTVA